MRTASGWCWAIQKSISGVCLKNLPQKAVSKDARKVPAIRRNTPQHTPQNTPQNMPEARLDAQGGILSQRAALVAVQTIEKRCTIGVCQKKVPASWHFSFSSAP
jgi:hypothetical protein